jgi:hypothetical protein
LCLIIDANKTADFVNEPAHEDHQPIRRWITEQGGVLALGGRLFAEQKRIAKAQRLFAEWVRAGRAFLYRSAEVDQEESDVVGSGLCKSDDPHVIALARVSGARVLFSNDRDLGADFANLALVPRPQGKIYKNVTHAHLLDNAPRCRFPDQRKRLPQRR